MGILLTMGVIGNENPIKYGKFLNNGSDWKQKSHKIWEKFKMRVRGLFVLKFIFPIQIFYINFLNG